jgi:hypothetical protein
MRSLVSKTIALDAAIFAGFLAVSTAQAQPLVSLTAPANGASYGAPASLTLTATATDSGGTVTNVAFYQGSALLGNAAVAPYLWTTGNVYAGSYALTAVATDNNGLSSTSGVANVTVTNTTAVAALQQVRTVFVIAMENHNFTQPNPLSSPNQILGNPAAPYLNSLITPGNSNAVQTAYATHYFNSGVGVHPSEPNYVWQEAATDFGFDADTDPSVANGNVYSAPHFTAQLNAAAIAWNNYQENLQFTTGPQHSSSGTTNVNNPYYGTGQYNYAPKHNPMAFFSDTYNQNVHELSRLFSDLNSNAVGRYNWITPNQYDDAHSALSGGFTYHSTHYTGDQAGVAQGDNFLATVVPQIMASAAYQSNGVIVIWWDETEGGDGASYTLPEILISPLAKGNAYASALPYSHSSDLKTMEEIFGLSFVSNSIPANHTNYAGAFNYPATVNDLSDFFQGVGLMITNQPASVITNAGSTATFTVGATAPTPLSYQWYFGTNALPGQTNSILSLASIGRANVGYYQVTVSSGSGTADSAQAYLTVIYQAPNIVGGQILPGTNGFQLTFSGPVGQTYEVLASDDLTVPTSAWPVVGTGTLGSNDAIFTDTDAANQLNRYYVIKSP